MVALLGAAVAACTSASGPQEVGGTLVGAVAGASSEMRWRGRRQSRGGHDRGRCHRRHARQPHRRRIDDDDKQRAYAAQMQALESGPSGAPVAWRNPDSGRYGSIVPGPAYEQHGMSCRQYTHTIYIDGKPQTARGAACRNPDGRWSSVI